MTNIKCSYCGFTAGSYTSDMYTGKLICIECVNRIESHKHKSSAATVGRAKPQIKQSTQYTQLKFNYHD